MITLETIQIWVSLIGNSGFPIAITIYLFIRFEKKIEDLEAAIMKLLDKNEDS
ncbi:MULTISPECIES: YvrJ family protein [Lysinibacillus]|uniref:YvrJ family protein n=1 Tax=Lysinibacillus irui TaxID=2998077 RepID=A0AAJ5RK75_9BACI|nr:YvrJ family protein [Lysinibacillus irui]MEA0564504.1 YvrJ family protein [Lysinibacillus irui]WDV06127.1 YvrJ family protein [Lysinibacillus irui]